MMLKLWLVNYHRLYPVVLKAAVIDEDGRVRNTSNILGLTPTGEIYRFSGIHPSLGLNMDVERRVIIHE